MEFSSQLTLSQLPFNKDMETHLVLTLKAPKINLSEERRPVCIMLCIDVSGSMVGLKLAEAKTSALRIIENLKETDYCGIVTFDDVARLVSLPISMDSLNKEKLSTLVKNIATFGCTNFTDGMLNSLQAITEAKIPESVLSRVIMLTDGHSNRGVTDLPSVLKLLQERRGFSSVSAFGYGRDANQDYLQSVAKEGSGNYAFIENATDALTIFGREIGGLLSTYARNIQITLELGDLPVRVLSDVNSKTSDKSLTLMIPEILGEETRHVVLSVSSLALSQANFTFEHIERQICQGIISYDVFQNDSSTKKETQEFSSKLTLVNENEFNSSISDELKDIVAVAQMTRGQVEAEAKANQGDYDGAYTVMVNLSNEFTRRGMEKHATASAKLAEKMQNARVYVSSSAYRKTAQAYTTRSVGLAGGDSLALHDLGEVITCNYTSSQDAFVESLVEKK